MTLSTPADRLRDRDPSPTGTRPIVAERRWRLVFPVVHTPYTATRFSNYMIETDIVVGAELKITCSAGRARPERWASSAGPSRRAQPCRSSSGILLRGERRRASSSRPPTWSCRCALRSPAQVEGDGAVVVPGRTLARHRPLAAGRRGHDRAPARRGASSTSRRGARATACTRTTPEDFPRLPELDAVETSRRRPRAAARDDRPRRPRRVARRVAAGADGHPRPVRAGGQLVMAATDSYRLAVKQTPLGGAVARAGGDRARPRALAGAGPHRRRRRRDRSVGVHENQVVFGADGVWLTTRRIDGQFPNYRQLLPEAFEHELRCPARRAARRRSPRLG